jgi:UDP-N-acetylmuramate-alanine ligase
MKYSPIIPKGDNILKHYKDLDAIHELQDADETIIKYILLTYDPKSPFREIQDITQRKHEVLYFLQMDDNGKFPNEIKNIIQGKNEDVRIMINKIIRLFNSVKYSLLVSNIENFYRLLDSNDSDDIKIIRLLEKDIYETTNELLALDKNQQLLETTFRFIHKENLQLWRPEAIAHDIKAKRKVMSEQEKKVTYESLMEVE